MKRHPLALPTEARIRRHLNASGWLAGLSAHDSPVLVYIVAHIVEHQRPPSQKEMAARFGWASRTAALKRVRSLAQAGYIAEAPGDTRPLKVLGLRLDAIFDRKEPPHDVAPVADRPRTPPARRAAVAARPTPDRAGTPA